MGVIIKVSKRISPKDKDKIKRKISNTVSARTDGKKITSVSRSKNVNYKKNK